MAATDVQRPFHRPGWVFEEKVDGWRVLASRTPLACGFSAGTVGI